MTIPMFQTPSSPEAPRKTRVHAPASIGPNATGASRVRHGVTCDQFPLSVPQSHSEMAAGKDNEADD